MSERDSFTSKFGFVLACIGSVVGMGNILDVSRPRLQIRRRFFSDSLYLFVIIIGFSGVIGEMAFGRATAPGPIGLFSKAFKSRGWNEGIGAAIGWIYVLGSLALALGYSVVVGWILKYSVGSIAGFSWAPNGVEEFGAAFGSMASAFGNNPWQIAGLVMTFIIMAGVAKGIEMANR